MSWNKPLGRWKDRIKAAWAALISDEGETLREAEEREGWATNDADWDEFNSFHDEMKGVRDANSPSLFVDLADRVRIIEREANELIQILTGPVVFERPKRGHECDPPHGARLPVTSRTRI